MYQRQLLTAVFSGCFHMQEKLCPFQKVGTETPCANDAEQSAKRPLGGRPQWGGSGSLRFG
jgi:hypothetical protein